MNEYFTQTATFERYSANENSEPSSNERNHYETIFRESQEILKTQENLAQKQIIETKRNESQLNSRKNRILTNWNQITFSSEDQENLQNRLELWNLEKQRKLEFKRKMKFHKEIESCTFQPNTRVSSLPSKSVQMHLLSKLDSSENH